MLISLFLYFIAKLYISPPQTLTDSPKKEKIIMELQKRSDEKDKKDAFERGRVIFYDPFLGSNVKSCATCHNKDKKFANRVKNYPIYSNERKEYTYLKDVIIGCIKGALDGATPKKDDKRLDDLEIFLKKMYTVIE